MNDLQFGVNVCLFSGFFCITGGAIFDYLFQPEEKKLLTTHSSTPTHPSKGSPCTFFCGAACIFIGTINWLISAAYAPQSILAAIGSLHLLWKIFWHVWLFGYKITLKNLFGTFCIAGGLLLIVFERPVENEEVQYSLSQLFHFYSSLPYVTYLTCICILYMSFSILIPFVQKQRWMYLEAFLFSSQTAMLGTQSLVLGKTMSTLARLHLERLIELKKPFNLVFFLVVCIFCLISTFFWIWRVGEGRTQYQAIPCIECLDQSLWILFSMVSGGIYFQEFEHFNLHSKLIFTYGCSLLVFGMYFLTRENEPENSDTTLEDLKDAVPLLDFLAEKNSLEHVDEEEQQKVSVIEVFQFISIQKK